MTTKQLATVEKELGVKMLELEEMLRLFEMAARPHFRLDQQFVYAEIGEGHVGITRLADDVYRVKAGFVGPRFNGITTPIIRVGDELVPSNNSLFERTRTDYHKGMIAAEMNPSNEEITERALQVRRSQEALEYFRAVLISKSQ